MKKSVVLGIGTALALTFAGNVMAATMSGWNVGWNDMAVISGGTATPVINGSALEYVNVSRANVAFATYDMFNGYFGSNAYSWRVASGDVGQHFFDGAIRDAFYNGPVPGLTAADWNGSTGVAAGGSYEWLLNNYSRDGLGNPTTLNNSWIRGTDSEAYDMGGGTFEANLTSDGTWYWYTPSTPNSAMNGWIQCWDLAMIDPFGDFSTYHDRYMTGNFRLVGNFNLDVNGLPQFTSATLQYEVQSAVVPVPAAAPLGLLGMGLVAFVRRRKNAKA